VFRFGICVRSWIFVFNWMGCWIGGAVVCRVLVSRSKLVLGTCWAVPGTDWYVFGIRFYARYCRKNRLVGFFDLVLGTCWGVFGIVWHVFGIGREGCGGGDGARVRREHNITTAATYSHLPKTGQNKLIARTRAPSPPPHPSRPIPNTCQTIPNTPQHVPNTKSKNPTSLFFLQ
jgi:hypothetical protein